MPTRQYIGARYVPKFAEPLQWSSAYSYEALTIVTNLGNSFTSKKPVPAGIDITNTEYWVNTGNYNAQVELYRQQTEQVQNALDSIRKERIIFLGDSYGGAARPFPWWQAIVNAEGLSSTDYINKSHGGVGFLHGDPPDNNNKNFLTEAMAAAIDMVGEPYNWAAEDVSKIIVCGGAFNDIKQCGYTLSTVLEDVKEAIDIFGAYCRYTFPNAHLFYFFPSNTLNYGTVSDTAGTGTRTVEEWLQYFIGTFKELTTPWMTWLENIWYVLQENRFIDTEENVGMLHPTEAGGKALGLAVRNAVYGAWSNRISQSMSLTVESANQSQQCRMYVQAQDNIVRLQLRDNIILDPTAAGTFTVASLGADMENRRFLNNLNSVKLCTLGYVRRNGEAAGSEETIPVMITGSGLNLQVTLYGPWTSGDRITIVPGECVVRREDVWINYHA